jgi:hypothetical protein
MCLSCVLLAYASQTCCDLNTHRVVIHNVSGVEPAYHTIWQLGHVQNGYSQVTTQASGEPHTPATCWLPKYTTCWLCKPAKKRVKSNRKCYSQSCHTCNSSVGLLQKVALRSPESLLKLRKTCLRLGNRVIEMGRVPVNPVEQSHGKQLC